MIFVKRDGINSSLAEFEYSSVFPEGNGYQQQLVKGGRVKKDRALVELSRKLKEDPECKRAQKLFTEIRALP